MAEEKHSLISEIRFDFGQAETDINTLVTKLQSLDEAFKKTDSQVRKTSFNIGESIREALRELRHSDGRIELDGSKIMKRIQAAFDSAIVSKGVEVTGLENTQAIQYEVPQTVANKIRAKILSKVREAVKEAGVKDITIEPFTVNMRANDLKAFRDQLQTKLNEAVAKNIKVDWDEEVKNQLASAKKLNVTLSSDHVNAIWTSAEKSVAEVLKGLMADKIQLLWSEDAKGLVRNEKFKVQLDASHLQNIIRSLETSVIEKIVSTGTVDFKGEIPKFKFPVEKFHEAFQKLQAELDELAKSTGLEVQKVAQVPKLGNQLNTLNEGLVKGIGHIIQLSEVLNNKFAITGNEKSVKDITDTISNLKTILLNKTKGVIDSLLKAVNETPASSITQAELRDKIAQVHAQMNEKIIGSLDSLPAAIGNALSNLRITLNSDNIIGGAAQTLERVVHDAILEAAKGLEGKLGISFTAEELAKINDSFKNLATQMLRNIYRETARILAPYSEQVLRETKQMTDSMDAATNAQVNVTAEQVEQGARQILSHFGQTIAMAIDKASDQVRAGGVRVVEELEQKLITAVTQAVQSVKSKDFKIAFPVKPIREKFLEEAKNLVKQLVATTTVGYRLDGRRSKNIEITIPNTLLTNAVTNMRNFLQEEVLKLLGPEAKFTAPALGDPQVRVDTLRDEVARLVGQVEGELRTTLVALANAIVEGVRASVPQEQVAQVRQILEAEMTSMYRTLLSTAQEAMAFITFITQMVGEIRNGIETSIVRALSEVNVTRGGAELTAVLQGALDNLHSRIIQGITAQLEQAQPYSGNVDVTSIMQPIRDASMRHLQSFVAHMVDAMSKVTSNIGVVPFSVQSLHSGVRQSLARQLGTTPAEFARMFPTVQGLEDMRLVMQENIRLVMERLVNRIVQASTRQVSELMTAIREVPLPNPDLSPAHLAARKMTDLQDLLVRRIRDMINNQFNALTQAINSIPVQPRDLTISAPTRLQQPSRIPLTQPVGSVGGVPRIGSTAGSFDARGYFPSPVPMRSAAGGLFGGIEPGGDTRTFMGAVVNTIRYMVSGMAIGAPLMAFNTAWESAKEFDYQMMKAEQNFRVKVLGDNQEIINKLGELVDANVLRMDLADIAVQNISRVYGERFANMSKEERTELVRQEALNLQGLTNKDAVPILQDIALANAIDPEEVAKAFHIASRRFANPREAIAMAREVAKTRSLEEVDVEQAAKGFEAIGAQWGLTGYDMRSVANMLIVAANLANTTIEDLLAVQQRSGSLFRRNLAVNPDGTPMTKREALAHSLVLSSMFVQATARKGGEAGTFFKAILERPFMREGLKAAETLSQYKGFEFMNPYFTDENGVRRQKSFTEVFANIIAASQMMDDERVKEFFKDLFPQWHAPGVASMGNFLMDMEHTMREAVLAMDRLTGTRSQLAGEDTPLHERLRQTLEAMIEKVERAGDSEEGEQIVAILRAMSMGTWKFQTQQIKTMWEVSTQGVFESLKDEFGQLNVYLLSILRYMRDNASSIAEGIVLLSKIAAVMGAKFVGERVIGAYKESVLRRRQDAYDKAIGVVNENARYLHFKRMVQGDEIAYIAARQREVQGRLMGIGGRMAENDRAVVDSRTRLREAAQRYKEVYMNYQGPDRDEKLRALRNEIQQHGQNLRRGKEEGRQLRSEYERESRILDRWSNQMNRAQQEMAELDYQATRLNSSMDALSKAMQDEGIDASKLRNQLVRLSETYQAQTLDARQYERQVRVIGEAFNMTERDMLQFKKQLQDLERQLEKGVISERQFFQRVQNLERQHFATTAGIPGGGVNGNGAGLFGGGLASDALTLLGMGALATAVPKRGIFTRLRDFASVMRHNVLTPFNDPNNTNRRAIAQAGWGAFRSFGALFGKDGFRRDRYGNLELDEKGRPIRLRAATPELPGDEALARRNATAGVLSRMGKFGAGLRQIGRLGNLLRVGGKAIPGLGTALLAFEGFNILWDVFTASTMLDHENKLARAEKLQSLVKDTIALDESKHWFSKALGTANFWFSAGANAIANMLGGNSPSWSESMKAWELRQQFDGKDLEAALEKELGAERLSTEARIAAQEYFERTKDPMDKDGNGKIDEEIEPGSMNLAPEDVEQLINEIQSKLQREMGKNESRFTIDQAKLLIQGVREDSKQMRDLMEEYLTKNIALIQEQLTELKARREKLIPGSDADQQLEVLQLSLEAQQKQFEAQLRENRFSRFNEIMNKLQEDESLIESKYSIKQSEAIIGGASEDSAVIRQLEVQKANELSRRIEQSQAELRDLLNQFNQDSREWKTIWMAIQQTEADQKKLLADISKQLGGKATFNLPSGIEPISYMDYITSRNTHRNMTMRQGDVTVNVTIGNMSGDPAAAKRLADEIAKQVRNAQVNVAQSLSQQVKTGTGQNYTSMLDLARG